MTMPIKIETILTNAVEDSGLRALMIFGPWGTGKTYVVTKYFEKNTTKDLLVKNKLRFAYVSLFGVESIAEVRRRLCVSVLENPGNELAKTIKSGLRALPRRIGLHGVTVDISQMSDLAGEFVQEKALKDLFVCVDDLERAGENLQIKEVFGFLAELVERRGSKCVLVLNREKLSEANKQLLAGHDEKVFDLTVEFKPSASDNVPIGLTNTVIRTHALGVFAVFQNANIRVMKRLAWLLRTLEPAIDAQYQQLWPNIIKHAAVLTIIKHSHSDAVGDLSEVIASQSDVARILREMSKDGGDPDKIPTTIRGYLDDLAFEPTAFDAAIVSLLNTGLFDETTFRNYLAEDLEKKLRLDTEGRIASFWKELKFGFIQNPVDFVSRLKNFLAQDFAGLRPMDFIDLCNVLLALDASEESKGIVERKIRPFIEAVPEARRPKVLASYKHILATNAYGHIAYVPTATAPQIADVIKEIAGSDSSWNHEAYGKLAQFSDEEIEQCLLANQGDFAIFQFRRLFDRLQSVDRGLAVPMRNRLGAIADRIRKMNLVYKFQVDEFVRPVANKIADTEQ